MSGRTFDKVMMCPPTKFKVEYQINPWMGGTVDQAKAMQQWTSLKNAIESCGIQVKQIEQADGLPDMVFCCNSGIAYKNSIYLAHFRHPERQGEREHYKRWFEKNGYKVHGDASAFFEGGGDAVFSAPDKLWAGYGFRSEKKAYDHIQKLGSFKTIFCELNNKRFYHIDVCFMPLSPDLALWYPQAFTEDTQRRMQQEIELIPISETEAARFACNGMTIDDTVILPSGCPETKEKLAKRGFRVIECEMSEFLKAGGAVQCLVMKL